jgi:transcriptional regulator with XRE-family HTH domain/methylmalonyl-CoA mutase cobalamin-binding subunit
MNSGIFGNNLKFYRQNSGLTQAQLAERCGTGQVSIAHYERGSRFPGEQNLIAIARSLKIPLELLFTQIENNNTTSTDIPFNITQFLNLLLRESIEKNLLYFNGWKKTAKLNLEESFSYILCPLLTETGVLWEKGALSISEEHLISGKVRELISRISSSDLHMESHNKMRDNVWLGFCAPSDKHDLVLFMLSQLVKNRGWETIFLGVDVPVNDLLQTIKKYKPSVISISISQSQFQAGLEAYLQVLEDRSDLHCPVIIGGRGFDQTTVDKYKLFSRFAPSLKSGYEYVLDKEK